MKMLASFKKTFLPLSLILVIVFGLTCLPFGLILAQQTQPTGSAPSEAGLVPCGIGAGPDSCTFDSLLKLVNNLLNFAIWIATMLAAALIIWAGAKLIWFQTNPGERKNTIKMVQNVIIGFFIVVSAWLLVKGFVTFFSSDEGPLHDAIVKVFGTF